MSIQDRIKNMVRYFPELQAFEKLSEQIDLDTASAGVKIDMANALNEAIGKNAWKRSDPSIKNKKIEKAKLPEILEKAQDFFKKDDGFSLDFYKALKSNALKTLNIRSKLGDISHGHIGEKDEVSITKANFELNLSLTFAHYYLDILDNIISGKLDYNDENNHTFNQWLDRQGESIGGAKYSWLVYNHDYDRYEAEFDNYSNMETEE